MMKYLTCIWDMLWVLKSAYLASYKRPATSFDSIHPNNQPGIQKSRNEIQLPTISNTLSQPMYTEPKAKRCRLGTHP